MLPPVPPAPQDAVSVAAPFQAAASPLSAPLELLAAGAALAELHAAVDTPGRAHRIVAGLHRVAGGLAECRAAGLDRHAVQPLVAQVRDLIAASPLVRRLQTWPRGYPGDFETVEWLCEARNRAAPGTPAWAVEQFALHSPVAQQHRNKVALQAEAIRRTVAAADAARILSIGCGGCRDLRDTCVDVAPSRATFVLVDADADALAHAAAHLARLADRCTFVQGRVPRVLAKLRPSGPFDLVVAGGLFDYLPERWAVETLRHVKALLAPGGRLVFSNIALGNPYGPLIEGLAEWFLIERSDDDLRALLTMAGFDAARVRIGRDGTGLAAMITAPA